MLRRILITSDKEQVFGDYEEEYYFLLNEKGSLKAKQYYWLLVLVSIPSLIINSLNWSLTMFRNYFKITIRNIKRQKIFSFINILGLSVGLTCCILIYLYITDELSYDRFHKEGERIYRVISEWYERDGSINNRNDSTPSVMGSVIESFFPEVEKKVRFFTGWAAVKSGEKIFRNVVTFTDAPVFEMFSFRLKKGNPETVLDDVQSVVLTEEVAALYFGGEDPIGKTLTFIFGSDRKDFIVSGISENVPGNSTIRFKILMRIENMVLIRGEDALTTWSDFSGYLYLLLKDKNAASKIVDRFSSFVRQYMSPVFEQWRQIGIFGENDPLSFDLQHFRKMHFDSSVDDSANPKNSLILAGIGFIIITIASINFMNISVGRASVRSVEIGMRKVVGAGQKNLISQFWSESVIMTLISMVFGILLAVIFLPRFNELSGKSLSIINMLKPVNIITIGILLLIVGVASGSYPALFMSRFRPARILKGSMKISKKNIFTKSLVIIQFALSVFLIISTIVLGRQINYLINKDLGFEKEGVISVRLQQSSRNAEKQSVGLYRQEALKHPGIINVAAVNASFGLGGSMFPLEKDGKRIRMYQYIVDPEYVPIVGINIVEGRNFSNSVASDTAAVIINRTFIREFGIKNPVGTFIGEHIDGIKTEYPYKLKIIGVMEDFNNASLHKKIAPVILHMQPGWGMGTMLVRIAQTDIKGSLSALETIWKKMEPDKPFIYSFMDEDIESQYNNEKKWGAIVTYSSIFAVVIACMGIFSLTLITINRRFKEIGIRKVLGAKISQIINLVLKDFIFLIVIANILAWPFAYYVMRKILNNFHYRISIGPEYFFLAGIFSIAIAFVTIIYLAVKAALSNPVNAINYE